MIRKLFFVFTGMLICFVTGTTALPGASPSGHIGILKVPPGVKPAKCYRLLRDEKPQKVRHKMPVFIGDVIEPLSGCSVRLIYRNLDYDAEDISERTIAAFPRAIVREKRGLVRDVAVITTRGGDSKALCFPSRPLNLSPWPVNGSDVLAGEPLVFRWFDSDQASSCEPVLLVIVPSGKDAPRIEEKMEAGELKLVTANLTPGQSYHWFVEKKTEKGKKQLFKGRHFKVMETDASENIRRELDKVGKQYPKSPLLYQTLYLQYISDASPDLDLYADSMRLMKQHLELSLRDKPIKNLQQHSLKLRSRLIVNLQRHCWPEEEEN